MIQLSIKLLNGAVQNMKLSPSVRFAKSGYKLDNNQLVKKLNNIAKEVGADQYKTHTAYLNDKQLKYKY
jgi:hypothetical protein